MIGKTIQNYQIISLLGEGGMGKVYKATDLLLGRTVAIKSLNANLTSQPQFLERFKNEAKTLAKLSHPNIALLYNYLQDNNDYYMVMEYVEGENLDELVKKNGSIPYQVLVPIICAALEGLDHAHKKGILHRDIKPANIMLTKEHNVKLMDFGIAKVSDAAKLTQASRVIGTIEFMAPELIEGKDPSIASDIYAIGVTMYELLCGKLPFGGKSDYMLMQDIIKEKPVSLIKLNNNIPKRLSDIVFKALEKKTEKRFLNAKTFLQALHQAFPNLNEIHSNDIERTIPATTLILKDEPLSPKPTSAHIDPLQTRLSTMKANAQSKSFNAMSLFQNKLLYILIVALLILFALYKIFFSNNNQESKTVETPVVAINTSDDTNTLNSNFNEPEINKNNSDSIALILNHKKEEDNNNVAPNTSENKQNNSTTKSDKTNQNKTTTSSGKTTKDNPVKKEKEEETNKNSNSSITINSPTRLRVNALLSLRENINPDNAHDGQLVSFRVLESVIMKGITIIPAGSIIHGNIERLGKIRMDLTFHSVTIKGKTMRLEDSKSSSNIKATLSSGSTKIGLRGTLYP